MEIVILKAKRIEKVYLVLIPKDQYKIKNLNANLNNSSNPNLNANFNPLPTLDKLKRKIQYLNTLDSGLT